MGKEAFEFLLFGKNSDNLQSFLHKFNDIITFLKHIF